MSNTVTLATIPKEAIIDLKISGAYYQDLKLALLNYTDKLSKEEVSKVLENAKANKIENLDELIMYILYTLTIEIENKAKEQGLIVDKEFDLNEDSDQN